MYSHDPWVYFRIYVDAGFPAIEHLLATVVPDIVATGGFDRWFFLRYIDYDGLHLRLRLRASTAPDALAARIAPSLSDAVRASDRAEPRAYRATIAPPYERVTHYFKSRRAADDRVVADTYAPEIDRFGVRGLEYAERLFEASSETSLAVLAAERRGEVSRKSIVPVLMWQTWKAFVGGDPGQFWDKYAAYWLESVPDIHARCRPIFEAKAAELRDRGTELLAELSSPIAAGWWRAVQAAAASFREVGEHAPRNLAFHFIHLTNNRLGLMQIEEAYFSILIGRLLHSEVAS
jgi:thiopeptide-type bacteriocin biosynthesis protein